LYDTDRSFSVEELARIAYPEITTIAKKHRVAVLGALDYVQERMLLWFFNVRSAGTILHQQRMQFAILCALLVAAVVVEPR